MGKKQNVLFITSNTNRQNRQEFYARFFSSANDFGVNFTYSLPGSISYPEIDKTDLVALDLAEVDDDINVSLRYAIDNHIQTFGHWARDLREEISPLVRVVSHFETYSSYFGNHDDLFSAFRNWYSKTTPGLQRRIEEDSDATYGAVKISDIIPVALGTAQTWVRDKSIGTILRDRGEGPGGRHGMVATRDEFVGFLKKYGMWDWLGQETESHKEANKICEITKKPFNTLLDRGVIPSYSMPITDQIRIPRLGLRAFLQNRLDYINDSGKLIIST